MNQQLNFIPENPSELAEELKEREGLFWLFMVYFPKDEYYPPDATQAQRQSAEKAGRKPIPEHQWDKAVRNAARVAEIRETLKWIG